MVEPSPPKRKKPELSLRARALAMLARREYSRQELARKLADYASDPDELKGLLDDFERRGWLSEQRVIEQVVHARRRRFGTQRIRHDLLAKGVPEDLVEEKLGELAGGELDAARDVWRRKFGAIPRNAGERARQIRFLQGRGFALETIMRVLKGGDEG
jgi:regulatory protein